MIESPSETFRRLYASEINFTVSTFWDSGYQWALGDELNGYVAKGRTDTFEQAVAALADAASAIYPDSELHAAPRHEIAQFARSQCPL